jgi:hypothetical protein
VKGDAIFLGHMLERVRRIERNLAVHRETFCMLREHGIEPDSIGE